MESVTYMKSNGTTDPSRGSRETTCSLTAKGGSRLTGLSNGAESKSFSIQRRNYLPCLCGNLVRTNRFKFHLDEQCSADPGYKSRVLVILLKYQKNRRCWLRADGIEGHAIPKWWIEVLAGTLKMEDLVFESPRPRGSMSPSAARAVSKQRLGSNNPMVRAAQKHEHDKLVAAARRLFLSGEMIGDIHKKMSAEFPGFRYSYSHIQAGSKIRGASKANATLAHLIGFPIEKIIQEASRRRGRKISEGQRKSEKFLRMASAQGASMTSGWRVSEAHKRLYDAVLPHDPRASMEHKLVAANGRMRSFDIYSPRLSAVLEMHGHVFHDPQRTTKGLLEMAKKNEKNDEFKKDLAESHGLRYFVFWDDTEANWSEQLDRLYE